MGRWTIVMLKVVFRNKKKNIKPLKIKHNKKYKKISHNNYKLKIKIKNNHLVNQIAKKMIEKR